MADRILDRTIRIPNGVVTEIPLSAPANMVTVFNPATSTGNIYISRYNNVSAAVFEAVATPGNMGILARPKTFKVIYVFAAAPGLDNIPMSEILTDSPVIQNMAINLPGTHVNIIATVGLKPSDLHIDATTKDLGVFLTGTVGIKPSDLNINPTTKDLGVFLTGPADIQSLPAGWSVVQDSAANTALTVTRAAGGAGIYHYLTAIDVSVSGAATENVVLVEVKDDTTVIYRTRIPASTPIGTAIHLSFPIPIRGSANKALSLEIEAGGAGCVMTGVLVGYSR